MAKIRPIWKWALALLILIIIVAGAFIWFQQKNNQNTDKMSYKLDLIESPKTIVGTRAFWDEQNQSLYYCDVQGGIFRYDYAEKKVYSATIDGESGVAFILPVANSTNEFAVGLVRKVGIAQWDGVSPKATVQRIAFEVEQDKTTNRWNGAKVDPTGRFYGGTMHADKGEEIATGTLYKYTKTEGPTEVVKDVKISNGLAWNQQTNKVYYIDSGKFNVKNYDWDPNTGVFSNEGVTIDFSKNGGHPGFLPDGLTIDTDGNLYVTTYGGSNVLKVDPKDGKVLLDIPIPSKSVTSVTFGGPNLDILYVVTASLNDSVNSDAGRLFQITGLGTRGFADFKVNM